MNQQHTNNRGWNTGLFADASVAAIASIHGFLSINQRAADGHRRQPLKQE